MSSGHGLKLFKNWIFNSWVIWEYFNWAKARQSCLYLMGLFPPIHICYAILCCAVLCTRADSMEIMRSMYHVCMIAYLIEFNEHLVSMFACAGALFQHSPAFARFLFPKLYLFALCRCIVSIICFFPVMNVDFECGAAIDLIVRNENWTRIYRCYVIHRGIG